MLPPSVAEIVAVEIEDTDIVETVKVAEVAFAGTRTVAETVAFVLFEDRVTLVPPGPAGPLRVTVPVELLPPTTVVGANENPTSAAGLMVRVALWFEPPSVPVMSAPV